MNERLNEALTRILGFFKKKPAADQAFAAAALAAVPYDPSRSPLLQAKRPVMDVVPPAEAQPAPAAGAVPGAAPEAAPEAAAGAAPDAAAPAAIPREVEALQLKTADLETRLAAAQETILKLAEEAAARDEAQRQALARTEAALNEFMAEQKAAQENDKTGERLAALDAACLKLGAGAAETSSLTSEELARLKEQLASLLAKMNGVEAKFPEMAATRDTAALLVDRQGGLEGRISMAEARVNEVSVRGELRDKLNARDFATARERVGDIERDLAVLAGLERRVETVEMDSRRVMKLEAGAAAMAKRLEKMESDLRNMAKEQVYVSTEHKAGGVVIEELRAKFANMSVVFDYLRKEIDQFKHKA